MQLHLWTYECNVDVFFKIALHILRMILNLGRELECSDKSQDYKSPTPRDSGSVGLGGALTSNSLICSEV